MGPALYHLSQQVTKMSNHKNVPNFSRQPAAQLVLEQRVVVLSKLTSELAQLLVTEFPSLKDKVTPLINQSQAQMMQLDSLAGDLILHGHGPAGVLASQTLKNAKENAAFQDRFPVPAVDKLEPKHLYATLENYLALDGASEAGRAFNVPEETLYGALIKDANEIVNKDLLQEADGLWVVNTEEVKTYTLKLTLGKHILLFSPGTGASLVTYSEIEKRWIQHTNWGLVESKATLDALAAFFDKTNVRDATDGELNKLYQQALAAPRDALATVANITGEKSVDIELKLNDFFKIRLIAEGNHSIINLRDEVQWTDLTLQTRRRLFRDAVALVANLKSAPPAATDKPKAVTKKVTADKLANAAPGRRARKPSK